jgi:hypothetical protein
MIHDLQCFSYGKVLQLGKKLSKNEKNTKKVVIKKKEKSLFFKIKLIKLMMFKSRHFLSHHL